MAMIPYEELVASLQQWRMRQGLATGPSDYLGMRTFDIGVADESAAAEYDGGELVDAGDLEVLDEDSVSVDAYSAGDEGYSDYGQQRYDTESYQQQSEYDDAQPAYDDAQPAYDDAQPAYDDADPAYDDVQPAYAEAAPVYDDADPVYDDNLAAEAPPSGSIEVGFGEEEEATAIAADPAEDDLAPMAADDYGGYDSLEPPPLEAPPFDDGEELEVGADEILDEEDEATRVGGDADPAPPPLAPPPDDELP